MHALGCGEPGLVPAFASFVTADDHRKFPPTLEEIARQRAGRGGLALKIILIVLKK
jgi:hypothetical protein